MGDYRKLRVWQGAYRLALATYKATRGFPATERYGLTSQLRRAATSVMVNLAEGAGRAGDAEFLRFARISRGSLLEVICELELARDLGYLETQETIDLLDQANSIGRGLTVLLDREKRNGRP